MTAAFIGLDVETTGLDAHFDIILEIGMVAFDRNLKPLGAWSSVVQHRDDHIAIRRMGDVVQTMHRDSGLWADLVDGMGKPPSNVNLEARRFIERWTDKKLPMLGSSVTFDRSFLARGMPEVLEKFHHRSLDATSVKLAAGTQFSHTEGLNQLLDEFAGHYTDQLLDELGTQPHHRKPHRPIYDICASAGMTMSATTLGRTWRP